MAEATKTFPTAAPTLSPAERLELAEQPLDGLDVADALLDAKWGNEAEDRLAACRRGEIRAVPLDEIFAK